MFRAQSALAQIGKFFDFALLLPIARNLREQHCPAFNPGVPPGSFNFTRNNWQFHMKLILFLYLALASALSVDGCKKPSAIASDCFKGRLEIKGQCMNYTIKVLEGKMDTGLIMSTWTDEATGRVHKDVFRLASVCNFPPEIKQGDEFYFRVETTTGSKDCAVCMAYYPTPAKELSIVVQKNGCQ